MSGLRRERAGHRLTPTPPPRSSDRVKAPLLALSHVALGLAGWWLSAAFGPSAPPPVAKTATKSDRPAAFHREADELVRRLRSDLARHAAEDARKVPPQTLLREKFLARLSSLAKSPDPAAAFQEALAAAHDEESEITAGARFVLWAQADPAAAVTFAQQQGLDSLASERAHLACELAGERLTPETLLPLLESTEHRRDDFLKGMARTQLSQRSVKQLAELVSGSAEELRRSVAFHLKNQWPVGRLDDLGAFVTLLDDPKMLDSHPDQWTDNEWSAWLFRFIAKHPDPDFAMRVKNGADYGRDIAGNTSLPLETRIAALSQSASYRFYKMPADRARQEILASLVRDEALDFLRSEDGPDLLYAFHHGRIDAPELLDRLNARFPAYAEADVLRDLLHRELCADDPVRAAALLEALPKDDRTGLMAEHFEDAFYQTPLETIREALELLPPSAPGRGELLAGIVDHGLNDYGPDYLDWIATLADPADREAALAAIARRIENSLEWEAREVRRIVGDTPLPPTD
jgi:hypothetical protein